MSVAKRLGGLRCHLEELGLGTGDFVLHGDQARPPQRHSPQFSAHAYCGQTAAWIKMSLGSAVGLGPGDIVSDGEQARPLPKKGTQSPIFGPCLL